MEREIASSVLPRLVNLRLPKTAEKKAGFVDPDDIIIEAIKDGNPEAFGTLVRRYEDFVYTLIIGIVRSPETAKDVAQEVFLRVYKSIRRFERRSNFKTWLYRVAYNTALACLAREKRMAASENATGFSEVDNSYRNKSEKITLEKIIGMLKPDYRAVIILYYYENLKYEEISEVLECPVGTVKVRLYRAKYELKQLWSKYAIQL
jgi:RNA polymerase sigma-70 factor (ECF subfamily)